MSIYRGPVFALSTIRRDYIYVLEKDSVVFSKSIHTIRADGFCLNFLSIRASTLNCIKRYEMALLQSKINRIFPFTDAKTRKFRTLSTPANRKMHIVDSMWL
jgi:hypothetical protein